MTGKSFTHTTFPQGIAQGHLLLLRPHTIRHDERTSRRIQANLLPRELKVSLDRLSHTAMEYLETLGGLIDLRAQRVLQRLKHAYVQFHVYLCPCFVFVLHTYGLKACILDHESSHQPKHK